MLFWKICILLQDSSLDVFNGFLAIEYDVPEGFSPAFLFASERDLRVDHIGEGRDFTCISDGKSYVIDAPADIRARLNAVVTI